MFKVIAVRPLSHYRIWIKFSDGVEGEVDLSHLTDKGVFLRWKEKGEFEKVNIDAESGAVAWGKEIDLCPQTLYMQITGKKVQEIFPNYNSSSSHA